MAFQDLREAAMKWREVGELLAEASSTRHLSKSGLISVTQLA